MLWFCVAAVVVIAGLMIAQARRMDRELELAGLLDACNDVHQARVEGWVRVEDLPMLVDWITAKESPPWLHNLKRKARGWTGSLQPMEYEFRAWAVKGFEILGTNAAPAIPQLMEALQKGLGEDEAVHALGLIGEPVWETAYELANGQTDGRLLGAFLLGGTRIREEESRKVLLKLTADPEPVVREIALMALAEFPNDATERMFHEMLLSGDKKKIGMGAYGLHLGGESAVKILVDAYDSTTNKFVKGEVLAAFSLRDDVQTMRRHESSPFWRYQRKRGFFGNVHSEIRMFGAFVDEDEEALWSAVRERVLAGKEAEVEKEIVKVRRAEAGSKSRDAEDWRVPR